MGKKITGLSPAKIKKTMAASATAGKKPNEKTLKTAAIISWSLTLLFSILILLKLTSLEFA